jgi:hypothetical protein
MKMARTIRKPTAPIKIQPEVDMDVALPRQRCRKPSA